MEIDKFSANKALVLTLPTADLFGCVLTRTPEQISWNESPHGLQASLEPVPTSLNSALAWKDKGK